jgi:hypothetical protein
VRLFLQLERPLRRGDLRLRRLAQQLVGALKMPGLDLGLGLLKQFPCDRVVRIQRRASATLGAASSTAAEGDVALTRSNHAEIAVPIRDLSSPRAARHLLPTAVGEPLRFLARRMSGNTPLN